MLIKGEKTSGNEVQQIKERPHPDLAIWRFGEELVIESFSEQWRTLGGLDTQMIEALT